MLNPLTKILVQEVGILLLATGRNHLLWLKHRRKFGAEEKGHLLCLKKETIQVETGTKRELRAKLMAAIGVNQNLLEVMAHQTGTGEMIRTAAGADLETPEVVMDLGEVEGEVGVRNLETSMAEMMREIGRVHGVVTALEDHPLGGLIIS